MNTLFKYDKKLGKEFQHTNKSIIAVRSKVLRSDRRVDAIEKVLISASLATGTGQGNPIKKI